MAHSLIDNDFLGELAACAQNLHLSGSLPPRVLRAIVRHLADLDVQHSVETGSGASTLLFSRLSRDHTVFALDVVERTAFPRRTASAPFDPFGDAGRFKAIISTYSCVLCGGRELRARCLPESGGHSRACGGEYTTPRRN